MSAETRSSFQTAVREFIQIGLGVVKGDCVKTLTLPLQQQRVSGQTIAVFVVERGYKPLLCFYVPHHFLLNSQVTPEPDTKK